MILQDITTRVLPRPEKKALSADDKTIPPPPKSNILKYCFSSTKISCSWPVKFKMAKPIGIKHKIKGADNKAKQMPCAVAREHPIRSPRPQSWATNVLVIPAKAIKPHTNVKNKIPAGSDARNVASLYQERKSRSKKFNNAKLPELIIRGQATFIKAFRRSRFVTMSDIKIKFTYFYHEVKPQKHTEYFDMSHLTTSIVYFTLVVCLGEYTCA